MQQNFSVLVDSVGNINYDDMALSASLKNNGGIIDTLFKNDAMLRKRECKNIFNNKIHCLLFFMDGMAKSELVDESIAKPVIELPISDFGGDIIDFLAENVLYSGEIKKTADVKELAEALIYGDTLVFAEGSEKALIVNSKGWQTRGIEQPENEKTLRGPKEGFTESLLMNTGLLR